MKHILLTLGLSTLFLSASALPNTFYAPSSRLAEGKWVKVGVESSGLYEITFEQLRNMGFSNPENVAVFGRGARQLSYDFTDTNGQPLINDNLTEVPVYYSDGKLLFYGLGSDNLKPSYDSVNDAVYFANQGLNIYCNRGYYFLTDTATPLMMQEFKQNISGKNVDYGYDYINHEKDLHLNNTYTGRLFWGESFLSGNPQRYEWDYVMNNPDTDYPAHMNLDFYIPRGIGAELSYGIVGSDKIASFSTPISNSYYFKPVEPRNNLIGCPSANGKVFLNYEADDEEDFANLDYWTITYRKHLPTLIAGDGSKIGQERITFDCKETKNVNVTLPSGFAFKMMDITDPTNPVIIPVSASGTNGVASFVTESDYPTMLVFDSKRQQKSISGYSSDYTVVTNQNLHAAAKQGADLIIITIPELREQAEEIAELHRTIDNLKVIVATVEEIYNEFSEGIPDPMAYRSFAKMTYEVDKRLQNILLFGPLNNDLRGIVNERDPFSTIIAYQSPACTADKGAHNCNDYYGMMSDILVNSLEMSQVEIGIGLLPCHFVSDAKRMVRKIREYLLDTTHAYTLNEYLCIGGLGDNHTHDEQAKELGNYVNASNNTHMVLSTLIIDAYGSSQARKRFYEYLNAGKGLITYIGHGSTTLLGKDKRFFSGDNVNELRNTRLPFMSFAGCLLTNTDRGQRGIGESMVTATDYGLIGSLAATRDTWSGQNMEFMKIFMNRMYKDGPSISSARLENPLSIGQVYARAKSQSTYQNEMAYQLICDPAIVIPTANRRIKFSSYNFTAKVGDKLTLDGEIINSDNKTVDTNFNGECVLKVLEPVVTLKSQDLDTGTCNNDGKSVDIEYRDHLLTQMAVEVVNGKFTADVNIPYSLKDFVGDTALVVVAAYDPSRRLGAGNRILVNIDENSASVEQPLDNIAPVIETLEYDNNTETLYLTVSDETALDLSHTPYSTGFIMSVDGRWDAVGSNAPKIMEIGRSAYKKSLSMSYLGDGTHSVRVEVKDAAGNRTSKEITFVKGVQPGNFNLVAESALSDDCTRFTIEGSPRSPRLIVTDLQGVRVLDAELEGIEYIWHHRTADGMPLAPGLYKAFILENSSESNNSHSESVNIPII